MDETDVEICFYSMIAWKRYYRNNQIFALEHRAPADFRHITLVLRLERIGPNQINQACTISLPHPRQANQVLPKDSPPCTQNNPESPNDVLLSLVPRP